MKLVLVLHLKLCLQVTMCVCEMFVKWYFFHVGVEGYFGYVCSIFFSGFFQYFFILLTVSIVLFKLQSHLYLHFPIQFNIMTLKDSSPPAVTPYIFSPVFSSLFPPPLPPILCCQPSSDSDLAELIKFSMYDSEPTTKMLRSVQKLLGEIEQVDMLQLLG